MFSATSCRIERRIGFVWGGGFHARYYGYIFPDWLEDELGYLRATNADLADMAEWELRSELRALRDAMAKERRDNRRTPPLMPMPNRHPVRFDAWAEVRCAEIERILSERQAHGKR